MILFSHPADFTPVCTSEFMTFASMTEQFAAYNTELVGLSVDGLYSHIAWLRTIKEKIAFRDMKDVEVTFPLIEDITMEVAGKYSMIMPGEDTTKAVRAVFIIDPDAVVRAIIHYPLTLGRNFDELLRVVKALQIADHFAVATPQTGVRAIRSSSRPPSRAVWPRIAWTETTATSLARTGSSAPGNCPPTLSRTRSGSRDPPGFESAAAGSVIRPAAAAHRGTGLAQHAVDGTVRSPCRGHQRADAGAALIGATQLE